MPHSPLTSNETNFNYRVAWIAMDRLVSEGKSWSGREPNCVFLNTGGPAFADISAVSGLDFPDDGRCVAPVDWDFDGDVDLWFRSRTAPRVQFMRNDCVKKPRFVALHLTGTRCNRDAIGARVELHLPSGTLIKTLRAGEGFISQAGKWLQFGLGRDERIAKLVVRWPGGTVESFDSVEPDKFYLLTEGEGRLMAWAPPASPVLRPSQPSPPPESERARIVLAQRVPLPPLGWTDMNGTAVELGALVGRPLLINMWASWCAPCVQELNEFASASLADSGLRMVALSADEDKTLPAAKALAAKLPAAIEVGRAAPHVLDLLDIFQRTVLVRSRRLPLPASFLLDSRGEVACIYKGPVGPSQVLEDMKLLDAPRETVLARAAPFSGRWLTPPRVADYLEFAGEFRESRQTYASAFYMSLASQQRNMDDRSLTDELRNLGIQMLAVDDFPQALVWFERAVKANPSDDLAWCGLALARVRLGKRSEAHEAIRRADELGAGNSVVQCQIGLALNALGDTDAAARHYATAVRLDSNYIDPRLQLAIILTSRRQFREAAEQYMFILKKDPRHADAANNLAVLFLMTQQYANALSVLRKAVQHSPEHGDMLQNLARVLATAPDERMRSPAEAIQFAERARKVKGEDDVSALDTLAVAFAAAGDFTKAVDLATRAVSLARESGQDALATDIQKRLDRYKSGQAFIQSQ